VLGETLCKLTAFFQDISTAVSGCLNFGRHRGGPFLCGVVSSKSGPYQTQSEIRVFTEYG